MYDGFHVRIPGDFSSAAFPLAAAVICRSELSIEGLDADDVQGDKKIISILKQLGADLSWQDPYTLKVGKNSSLSCAQIDVNDCIDALPILAVVGCFGTGPLKIYNAATARVKESDRISCITKELKNGSGDTGA
jgi:3-phosphoshikimate 1-carboxyvinyltransferase